MKIVTIEKNKLFVIVLSDRDGYQRRQSIRRSWANWRIGVIFVVAEQYCPFPQEEKNPRICMVNTGLSSENLTRYHNEEDSVTSRLRLERDTIIVPAKEIQEDLPRRIESGYRYALKYTSSSWLLIVNDNTVVQRGRFEIYLKNTLNPEEDVILIPETLKQVIPGKQEWRMAEYFPIVQSLPPFSHVVSRSVAQHFVDNLEAKLENLNKTKDYSALKHLNNPVELLFSNNLVNDGKCKPSYFVIGNVTPPERIVKCHQYLLRVAGKSETENLKTISENPGDHLHWLRFDVIFKLVYAYFYTLEQKVPSVIEDAYIEHIYIMNKFLESCRSLPSWWFDADQPCKNKHSKDDFLTAFQNTLKSIQQNGFMSNASQIPVGKYGYVLNGAHRLSASIILSINATFQYFNDLKMYKYDYPVFERKNQTVDFSSLVVLEWMRIQLKLPRVTRKVSIMSLFVDDPSKERQMLAIVQERCSVDRGVLFERKMIVNKLGISQLIRHMYGNQPWLNAKVYEIQSLFKSSTMTVRFLFFFGKSQDELKSCKTLIRKLYNLKSFKASAHIPDNPAENLILAEMVLNPNSQIFLNYAENGKECQAIASELAKRSSIEQVNTLPGIYIGRDDVMVDSGTVLHLFNLRSRTDVDIVFLRDIDKRILGKENGFGLEAHAFKSNAISPGRPWGQDHFTEKIKTEWDLFYDPNNFGYCYGIKFVSLEQLIRYKRKRKEPGKDQRDVNLMDGLLKKVHQNQQTNQTVKE